MNYQIDENLNGQTSSLPDQDLQIAIQTLVTQRRVRRATIYLCIYVNLCK